MIRTSNDSFMFTLTYSPLSFWLHTLSEDNQLLFCRILWLLFVEERTTSANFVMLFRYKKRMHSEKRNLLTFLSRVRHFHTIDKFVNSTNRRFHYRRRTYKNHSCMPKTVSTNHILKAQQYHLLNNWQFRMPSLLDSIVSQNWHWSIRQQNLPKLSFLVLRVWRECDTFYD